MDNFIIFSLARCGSSALMELLNLHPGIHCMDEPFNPDCFEGRYIRDVSTLEDVDRVLAHLFESANGIKHVWTTEGWPFPSTDHNSRLLSSGARIVFLRRRNILRRVASELISWQLREWKFVVPEAREKHRSFSFHPLDTDYVRVNVDNEIRVVNEVRRRLEGKAEIFDLWYEDLYDSDTPLSAKHDELDRLRKFLSIPTPDDPDVLTRIEQRLDLTNRVNSEETYLRIPGILGVEIEFGSDETGWLFSHQRSTCESQLYSG